MTTKQQQAPGCFGAASVFSVDSKFCQKCVAFEKCSEKVIETLEAIKDSINVSDILKRHRAVKMRTIDIKAAASQPVETSPIPVAQPAPITSSVERKTPVQRVVFEISKEDQAIIDGLPVKPREQATVLCKQNKIAEMRELLPKGENPFATSGPAYLRVACDLIMNGGFTKANLRKQLIEELKWSDGTAASHVTIICILLYTFGIVVGKDNGFALNPALGTHHDV